MTVSVTYFISKSCTTCLFISKSFKELFFMASFSKADAKVRTIFELPKLFRRNSQKKVFLSVIVSNHCFSFSTLPHSTLESFGLKSLQYISISKASLKNGGYLLSHKRSTIGVTRLNFSVRNGKRWNPCAIAT